MLSSIKNSGISKESIIFQKHNKPRNSSKTGSNLMGLGSLTGQHSSRC
jgi:hypothetical protein